MTEKGALKTWAESLFRATLSIIALIAYFRTREWFIPKIGAVWVVGFFEGVIATIIVYYYVGKYGDAINETYLGLRELGQQRKMRIKKK